MKNKYWLLVMAVILSASSCFGNNRSRHQLKRPIVTQVGIRNAGNTCYMNSVLQVLLRLYPDVIDNAPGELGKKLMELKGMLEKNPVGGAAVEEAVVSEKFMLELIKLFREEGIWDHNKKKQDDTVRQYTGQQGDSGEFLLFLIDKKLEKQWLPYAFFTGTEFLKENNKHIVHDYYREDDANNLNEEGNRLPPIRNDFTIFNILQDTQNNQYPDSLNMESIISNKFKMNEFSTDGKQRFERQLILKKMPKIIYFQVNRTGHNAEGVTIKIPTKIIGSFNISIKRNYYKDNNMGDTGYYLRAFIKQSGTKVSTGHYYAYIKNNDGNWIYYSDSTTRLKGGSDDNEVKEAAENAYLYFYEKNNP